MSALMPVQRGRTDHEDQRLTQSRARESFPTSGLQPLSHEPLQVPFAVGDVIASKYEVIGLLGSGGMGYVISARHTELGEMVALKFLRPEALAHADLVERFAREARAVAKIRSEHVAHVFDVGSTPDGVPFIVMEYLAGKDLADHLHQEGPLPISVAVDYIMQACEALAAAHSHGIVHRDIKPENLFLTRQAQGMDVIKILDFGISKIVLPRGKRDLVRTQMALGSPVYMSPEQIRSSDQVDARSDIWAIGCVLFELLTGVTAFDEPSLLELSAAILEREPVPLQTLRPDASSELEDVVLRCLAKNPADRFQNVAELAAALYPFAPRRARISAERCYHVLRNAGIVSTELQLASAYPPPIDAARLSAPSLVASRTTTPAVVDLLVEEDVAPRTTTSRKWPAIVALGVLATAGAFAFVTLQGGTDPSPAASPAPARGAELPARPTPLAEPDQAAPPSVDEQSARATPPASAAAGSVSAGRSTSRPLPRALGKSPARPAQTSVVKRPRAQDDDLDPGF